MLPMVSLQSRGTEITGCQPGLVVPGQKRDDVVSVYPSLSWSRKKLTRSDALASTSAEFPSQSLSVPAVAHSSGAPW